MEGKDLRGLEVVAEPESREVQTSVVRFSFSSVSQLDKEMELVSTKGPNRGNLGSLNAPGGVDNGEVEGFVSTFAADVERVAQRASAETAVLYAIATKSVSKKTGVPTEGTN